MREIPSLFIRGFLGYSSTKCADSKKVCAVLIATLYNSKMYYLVSHLCKKVNRSRNSRFGHEVIGEKQPEMELLKLVAFMYPFSLKAGCSISSATRI